MRANGEARGHFYLPFLLGSFEAALAQALPGRCLPGHLPDKPKGKTWVIGAGKASAKMAQVFEDLWPHDLEGVVVTRYGHSVPTQRIRVIEAAHPVPDRNGQRAAREILSIARRAEKDDLVVFLLSGGGSALLSCPYDAVGLEDMQSLNAQLLKSGASIHEINTVRKHLNHAFGGRLAQAAFPARVLTLAISDVAGDDPSTIASGPTVGDPGTLEEARAIIDARGISVSDSVRVHLQNPENETPKPGDACFSNTEYRLIATPQKSLEAAAAFCKAEGYAPFILSGEIEGDTNEAAAFHAALARQVCQYAQPFPRPCVLLSGGETTVKVTGTGQGGPNTQFMLSAALALGGQEGVYALACDTDGIDGSKDNAGAHIAPDTLQRAARRGLDARAMLADNNSCAFFEALGDLVVTGPTFTNVNDYRAFLIL